MNTAPSYASAQEARAYVARVLARPRPASPPRIYVIASAQAPQSAAWPTVMRAARAKFPGCELANYYEVFRQSDRGLDHRLGVIAEFAAALVITRPWADLATGRRSHVLGYGARQEADALTRLGMPVLVLTPSGLAAWPDVRVRPAEGTPSYLPIEVQMPAGAPPPGLLPTVAASYRALGIAPPRPRKPRKSGNTTKSAARKG